MNPASATPWASSSWPHRLAVALVCATFPLIWVGGLVTTYEAGMAVPDWPNTYGYNLLLYPWTTWISGPFDLFIEHGHRLLGAMAGLITLALAAAIYRYDCRPAVRRLGLLAVAVVIGQGALGGLRVLADERLLAQIHACTGPAFFALAVSLAVVTSPEWTNTTAQIEHGQAARWVRLALWSTALVYIQLVLGSYLRHARPHWHYGVFQAALAGHLLVATALASHVVTLAGRLARVPGNLRWRSLLLAVLVAAQVALGCATWVVNYGWPAWIRSVSLAAPWTESYVITAEGMSQSLVTTAHVATGSLILVWTLSLALVCHRRLVAPGASPAAAWAHSKLGGAA